MSEEKAKAKSLSFTHKQLGITGTIVALMVGLSQFKDIKELFWTREEGQAQVNTLSQLKSFQDAQFAELKQQQESGTREVKDLLLTQEKENIDRLRRLNDLIIDRIKEASARAERNNDNTVRRIENLEVYAFKRPGR